MLVVDARHSCSSSILPPTLRNQQSRRTRSQAGFEQTGTTEGHDEQQQRTDSSDARAKTKARTKPSNSGGSHQHDDRHDHHHDRRDHHQDRRDHRHDRRASSGEVLGRLNEGGGDVGSGGLARRRMCVRVHFDRFAPQWDEL